MWSSRKDCSEIIFKRSFLFLKIPKERKSESSMNNAFLCLTRLTTGEGNRRAETPGKETLGGDTPRLFHILHGYR